MQNYIESYDDLNRLLLQSYYFEANQTEKYWVGDNKAALKIQSKFKMYLRRKQYLKKLSSAIRVQTAFRAYRARKQYRRLRVTLTQKRNVSLFSAMATIIQKHVRCFLTKKKHNYYKRKRYIQDLVRINQEFKVKLDQQAEIDRIDAEERKNALAKAEFNQLAKNLHHLSSTKAVPGVYNPPFQQTKPMAFKEQVETHLRRAFHQNYKWEPPRKKSGFNESKKLPKLP